MGVFFPGWTVFFDFATTGFAATLGAGFAATLGAGFAVFLDFAAAGFAATLAVAFAATLGAAFAAGFAAGFVELVDLPASVQTTNLKD